MEFYLTSPFLHQEGLWAWRHDSCPGSRACMGMGGHSHVVAHGSAARGTSAGVPPTDPGQGLRREMMGCSLEVGEDAERKRGGGFTASWGVGAVSLSSSTMVGWWLWEHVLAWSWVPATLHRRAWMLNSFFHITKPELLLGWAGLDKELSRFW